MMVSKHISMANLTLLLKKRLIEKKAYGPAKRGNFRERSLHTKVVASKMTPFGTNTTDLDTR